MPRILVLLLVASALTLAGAACGGDDNKDSSPTASVRPTNKPNTSPGSTVTPVPDGKTPAPGETPGPNATPGPSPLSATPASRGTRATLITDPTSFFANNYPGVSPVQQDCQYNIPEVIVNCDGTEYAPDPPLIYPGTECFALLVNSERVALRCTSQEPATTAYYDIQG